MLLYGSGANFKIAPFATGGLLSRCVCALSRTCDMCSGRFLGRSASVASARRLLSAFLAAAASPPISDINSASSLGQASFRTMPASLSVVLMFTLPRGALPSAVCRFQNHLEGEGPTCSFISILVGVAVAVLAALGFGARTSKEPFKHNKKSPMPLLAPSSESHTPLKPSTSRLSGGPR
jgi:hypothetical protein